MNKLITILYLEDDEPVVDEFLRRVRVGTFFRLEMDGHGIGVPGWDGTIPCLLPWPDAPMAFHF